MNMSRKISLILLILSCFTLNLVAKENAIQCGNLIFAGNQTSRCFSDEFLSVVQKKTSIATERRFKSVKLASDELFKFPFVVMTAEANFFLTKKERENLKKYLESGGFLLASAGCSSKKFDSSFRREMKTIFGKESMKVIKKDHLVFQTVKKIDSLELHKGDKKGADLEGIEVKGRLVMCYSKEGLNDSANSKNCCCCGGNEIENAQDVNVNILVYSLLH